MRIILTLSLITLSISCVSQTSSGNDKWTYELFAGTTGDRSNALKNWGEPTEIGKSTLGKEVVEYLRYRDSDGRHTVDFLIDPKTNLIIERTFSPKPHTTQFSLQKLKERYFKKIDLDRIPLKCAHYDETLHVNTSKGISILTEGSSNIIVRSITFSDENRLITRLANMKTQNCRKTPKEL